MPLYLPPEPHSGPSTEPGGGFAEPPAAPAWEPPVARPPEPPDAHPATVPAATSPSPGNAGAEGTDDPFDSLFGPRDRPPPAPAHPVYTGDDQYYPEPPPRQRRTKIIAIVAAVLAVLAAGGGVAAWALTRHPAHSSAQGTGTPRPHVSTTPPTSPARPTTSPPVTPSPTSTGLVTVAPGVPPGGDEPTVVAFLNSYFTAINNHDYQQYRGLLDAQMQQQETAAVFRAGYRGSHDSAATLTGLTSAGAQVAASVSFTSHQPAAVSPTHSGCTDWTITLYLTPQGGSYLIGSPPSGYHASYQAC